jgi:hypothetical protein
MRALGIKKSHQPQHQAPPIRASKHTMRRISRLDRSIGLLQPRLSTSLPSTYSCSTCHRQAPLFSTSPLRRDEEKTAFTEKLRRKIWGTENPPGLQDPYGGGSFLDKNKKSGQKTSEISPKRDTTALKTNAANGSPEIDSSHPQYKNKRTRRLERQAARLEREAAAAATTVDGTSSHNQELANISATDGTDGIWRTPPKPTKLLPNGRKLVKITSNGRSRWVRQSAKKVEVVQEVPQEVSEKLLRLNKWRSIERRMHKLISVSEDLPQDYVPATTWEGLETLGTTPPGLEEHWSVLHPYPSFTPKEKETDNEAITVALHRAMVEVFSMKQMGGINLASVSIASAGPEVLTDHVQIIPSQGDVTLQFSKNASLEKIIERIAPALLASEKPIFEQARSNKIKTAAFDIDETKEKVAPTNSEEDVAADRSTVDPLKPKIIPVTTDETNGQENPTKSEENVAANRSAIDTLQESSSHQTYEEVIASWDPKWLQVSLAHPNIKFAVRILFPCHPGTMLTTN